MLSVSVRRPDNPANRHTVFSVIEPTDIGAFCQAITHNVWSPLVWQDGKRSGKNFLSCGYLALDFDNGQWSLKDAENWLKDNNYRGIIGTTKSHQLPKIKASGETAPSCDRFRVVVPLSKVVTDKNLYTFMMREVMARLPCDESCKDTGRFFWPCVNIVTVYPGDTLYAVPESAPSEPDYSQNLTEHKQLGTLPGWAVGVLMGQVPEGNRHRTCYRLGAELSKLGYTREQIINMASQTTLKEIGLGDLTRAIDNGIGAAR